MSEQKVTSLFDGATYEKTPSPECIKVLEDALEMARSGEISGVVLAYTHFDGCGAWSMPAGAPWARSPSPATSWVSSSWCG